jgi:hypothetical protein
MTTAMITTMTTITDTLTPIRASGGSADWRP